MKIFKDYSINYKVIRIKDHLNKHYIPLLIMSPKNYSKKTPVVLWFHGGGFKIGFKEMAYMGRPLDMVKKYHCTVISVGYRLSFVSPFPSSFNDSYDAYTYVINHLEDFNSISNNIIIGGESAGGNLAVAVSLKARDDNNLHINYQFPLYPMLSNIDTETSKNNTIFGWNTKKNHRAWKMYLGKEYNKETVSKYASPSREKDYSNLPPCYTFVSSNEAFLQETKDYINNLKNNNIKAELDIYDGPYHAFDFVEPNLKVSKQAINKFNQKVEEVIKEYY